MKLDPTDPLIQRIVEDDRPIALRKRRRSTIGKSPEGDHGCGGGHLPPRRDRVARTPAKPKKKVRFSDPGPEISLASTGITPFVQRTSLRPNDLPPPATPRLLERPARRRASLPPISTSMEPSSPVEFQFTPLRQVLTPRTRRQIARNNLSEEMNNIEAERKVIFKQEQEIEELKEELALARQSTSSGDTVLIESSDRIPDFSDMVSESRRERRPSIDQGRARSASDEESVALIDSTGIYVDPDCVLVESTPEGPLTPALTEHEPATADQGNQTEASASSISDLESHVSTQTAHLLQARLELERLFPGETALPLTPLANGDCSPLLSAMLQHLVTAQSALQTTKSSLRACEIQQSNLRGQFNNALATLEATREAHATLLKGAKAGAEKYAQARQRIGELETEVDEGSRSAEKLRTALNSYRKEVQSLESLITRLEQEGKEKLGALKSEMDEAVADLECCVAAETRGRREAEEELDVRSLQIRMLEGSQKELKDAISEKQGIVRTLEEELEEVKQGKEQEVGRLNVKVGSIEEALASAKADIQRLERDKAMLAKAVVEGQQREMRAVASLKEELRKAVRGVEGVVGGWEKDATSKGEGVKVGGLMTPTVEGGRFRNVAMDSVEGTVETRRGKSRRSRKIDSGIGILEEDVMAD